ncbi:MULTISPECIES: tetratricopeptide repeat protein [Leptolyngbya]|uniref:tetratricopeptide repeat protein n=1 Tax=Leptolyngbya TaxID=47251 RepID=UPI00168463FF|nr:tetratricopeptide repeat protein [Leptolyngbya sp. FACHB-1624]MBD1855207.1 tetratricopeptide repeat protein [Leptolyngbya sp. FACHB-1624]
MSRQYNNYGRDQFNIETLNGSLQVDNRTNAQQNIEVVLKGTIAPKHSSEKWVKRQQVEAELMRRLEAQVLLEMLGQGGFGKTDLAAWLYAQKKADFERSLWVDAAKVESFNQFARWVLQELRYLIDQRWDDEALIHELARRLTEHRCLLVVDQAEQLTESAIASFDQFVQYWQERGERSFLLVTTRRKVVTDARSRLAISGLTDAEGAEFLAKQGIGAIADQGLVRLTQLANGHPLLLGLAASWVRQEAKGSLSERDLDFFERLFRHYQGDSEAKVEEIFAVLFAALPERLRSLLLGVVVYRDAFGLEMAQAMLEDTSIEDLQTLSDRAFLRQESERWTLHPLMLGLVEQELKKSEQHRESHERAIAYFTANIQPWTGLLSDCAEKLEIFHHRCELGECALAYQIMDTCFKGLDQRGYYLALLPVYERLTQTWTDAKSDEAEEQRNLGWAWTRLGGLHRDIGQYQKAILHYESAWFFFNVSNYSQGKASVLNNLGGLYEYLEAYQQAIEMHHQSLDLDRENNDLYGEACSLTGLGNSYNAIGRHHQAIKYHEQALEIRREIEDHRGEAFSLSGLGQICVDLEQYERAINFYQQSLEIQREIGARNAEGSSLGNLAKVYYLLGQYQRAIEYYKQALVVQREVGNRDFESNSLVGLGCVYQLLGQYDCAIDFYQQGP